MRIAFSCDNLKEVPDFLIKKCTVICIDEGQFFDDIVEFSVEKANIGKTVIIAALDGTFEQKPFGEIMRLIPLSESVRKLSSVCMCCYKEASFSRRLNSSDKRVKVIGNDDQYAATCRRCLLLDDEIFYAKIMENRKFQLQTPESSGMVELMKNQKAKRKMEFGEYPSESESKSSKNDDM